MKQYRFLQFTGLALIALLIASCTNTSETSSNFENVQHFRGLLFSETTWDPIKGTNKLSAEEAKTITNYTFTYDDEQRLVKVEYGRGETLLDKSRLGAAQVVITYEDNKEIRHYFNSADSAITVAGDVFKSVYEYNAEGFKTGLKFYGIDGEQVENRNKIAYYIWSKTPMGLIKENRFNLAGEEVVLNEFCPFYELRFTYDENGYVTRMANYAEDALYDCTAENCGNIGVSYFLFKNDENGGLLEFSVHSTTGQLSNLYWGWAKFVQTLDENGYVTERVWYDQDDELRSGKNVPINQYTYDEFGSVIEERNLNAAKELMNHPTSGIAIKQHKYDADGRRIETINLDKDMNVVES